jgi:homoserine dehydrogenase
MKVKKVGIIGLGNVGEAVLRSFNKYSSLIARRSSWKIEIVKVCDANKAKEKLAKKFSHSFTTDPYKLINDPGIDIIVELMGGIEPAYSCIVDSLKKGKSIVTANKALLATKGKEIFALAKAKNKSIGFEASVCGAIPIIKSVSEGLISCEVKSIYGILNGTTNYILYKMHKENIEFKEALKRAQTRGLAERKPDLDIKGIDALHKLCILSYLCYGVWPSFKKVYTEGISKVSLLDISYAKELGYRIKLLAIAKKGKDGLELRVHPTFLPIDHPLAEVSLAFNAIYFNTQPAGELIFYGQGAGGVPTSSSVISDIVNIASGNRGLVRKEGNISIRSHKELKTRYYIRFMAKDKPGVLAKITKVLSLFDISIASVNQKERKQGGWVPLIIVTHQAKEDSINKALSRIDALREIKSPTQLIRIEDL